MISLPGLSSEAITQILVFGVAPLALVCAMARAIYESAVLTPLRFQTENILVRLLSFPAIAGGVVAMYFWTLAIASLLQEWYPENVPDLALSFTAPLLQLTDALWGLGNDTPITLSWLASAATYHCATELLSYLLGLPARRRADYRYKAAEDALGQKPAEKAEEKSSILKKGY